MPALPFLDEHATDVAADAETVWLALLDIVERAFSGPRSTRYARLVSCAESAASGPRPLAEGSTIPGFRVTTAIPGRELALRGRHRFSTYALTFRIDSLGPGSSRLRAESRAGFPGFAGRLYRLAVVGTRGHVLVVRRLLSAVRHRAEARGRPSTAPG